ncbi:zinc finger protein ZFP2-like isoform X1 [Thunnus thynnus]|uniref:zinc finger protein ZFP2-like isoform X1 n=2 Tax=Thunnus thynnus TaxID=8237 RepID=UPI0035295C09
MSAEQRRLPAASSPAAPGAEQRFAAADPPSSPQAEMDTLRMFVTERLTAAVDDILGLFGSTVARYREQIDRQRRQLDTLRSEEENQDRRADVLQASWIKPCPEEQILSFQPDQTDIKTEEGVCDAAGGSDAAAGGSDTEDSADYWTEAAGLWRPEETAAAGGQSSSPGRKLSPERPPVFGCKVCGESFQRRSYLLSHAAAHVRDCSVCGKQLEAAESLKLHLRAHRETSFRCSVCGQTFTLRGNLRTHMRIHSGERPFGCTVCGKSFGRRATLVRHVRSHTGEKPFTCSYCGRGFVEKGNLTVHLRTHTGERPYCCSTCDRRFSQLSCFYKHPCQRGRTSAARSSSSS